MKANKELENSPEEYRLSEEFEVDSESGFTGLFLFTLFHCRMGRGTIPKKWSSPQRA